MNSAAGVALVVGVAAGFFGLFTFKFKVCCPEDAGEEHDDDDRYDYERGSDVHGVTPCVDRLANRLGVTMSEKRAGFEAVSQKGIIICKLGHIYFFREGVPLSRTPPELLLMKASMSLSCDIRG